MAVAMAMVSGTSSYPLSIITPISEPLRRSHGNILLLLRPAAKKKQPFTLHLSRAQSNSSSSEPSSSSSSSSSSSPPSSPSPSSPSSGNQKDRELNQSPSWAQPGSTEPLPWDKKEPALANQGFELPFYVYLLASSIVAIAAIGSIFEYTNKKPIFGVVFPDDALYTPILGFFAITGLPTAAFLWFKSIDLANKAAREQDQEDGFYD